MRDYNGGSARSFKTHRLAQMARRQAMRPVCVSASQPARCHTALTGLSHRSPCPSTCPESPSRHRYSAQARGRWHGCRHVSVCLSASGGSGALGVAGCLPGCLNSARTLAWEPWRAWLCSDSSSATEHSSPPSQLQVAASVGHRATESSERATGARAGFVVRLAPGQSAARPPPPDTRCPRVPDSEDTHGSWRASARHKLLRQPWQAEPRDAQSPSPASPPCCVRDGSSIVRLASCACPLRQVAGTNSKA